MPVHDETIKDIDTKIEQNQRLLSEAQKWVNLLGTLQNNLAVLKRAKALLASDEVTPEPSKYVHVTPEPQEHQAQEPGVPPQASRPPESNAAQGLIGKLGRDTHRFARA